MGSKFYKLSLCGRICRLGTQESPFAPLMPDISAISIVAKDKTYNTMLANRKEGNVRGVIIIALSKKMTWR